MSQLLKFNLLASVGPQSAKPVVATSTGLDMIMLFGFAAAFLTIIAVIYQHEIRSRLPLLPVCVSALGVYGFLAGSWTLGFAVMALSASEFSRWWKKDRVGSNALRRMNSEAPASLYESDSRVARMFGRP